ncbi:hypothetical protein SAMN06269185_0397 [Natronoarchaeum philippinense]|uniref:Uncharacterized protein n=1 Tax=Natronoarchaeum philippinense TaxID=558529 RepID=A0A285N395_NATPI|nr:hypothetical protein [Natronoarchaeum philippinense]SNZ03899.1 hypothetical protein SAMN06269185_0397 [Natronoarchaeum philippinense]
MVGPTREEAMSRSDYRYLAAAFVALLAISGGLVALQSDASLVLVALSVVGGTAVGLVLVAYLRWTFRS